MNSPITKPLRYEKNAIIYVNGEEYTLIDYIKKNRQKKKITKKFISNIIKNNDYWYSQIEMGKKDNNRRKFINRQDLIHIISVVIYDAKTPLDLERFYANSENYIDNIIKVTSYDKQPRVVPLYELMNKNRELFNHEYSNNRIDECLNDLNSVIKDFYNKCNPIEQDSVINFLNTLILNLSIEPIIALHYYGLPFCTFFSAQPKDETCKTALDEDALNDLDSILTKYSQLLCENDIKLIIKRLIYHIQNTEKMIDNPFK